MQIEEATFRGYAERLAEIVKDRACPPDMNVPADQLVARYGNADFTRENHRAVLELEELLKNDALVVAAGMPEDVGSALTQSIDQGWLGFWFSPPPPGVMPFDPVREMTDLYRMLTTQSPAKHYFIPVPGPTMPLDFSVELAGLTLGPLTKEEWARLSEDIRTWSYRSWSSRAAADYARQLVAPKSWARATLNAGHNTAREIIDDRLVTAIAILHTFAKSLGIDPNQTLLGERLEPAWQTAFCYPLVSGDEIARFETAGSVTDTRRDYELQPDQLTTLFADTIFAQDLTPDSVRRAQEHVERIHAKIRERGVDMAQLPDPVEALSKARKAGSGV